MRGYALMIIFGFYLVELPCWFISECSSAEASAGLSKYILWELDRA